MLTFSRRASNELWNKVFVLATFSNFLFLFWELKSVQTKSKVKPLTTTSPRLMMTQVYKQIQTTHRFCYYSFIFIVSMIFMVSSSLAVYALTYPTPAVMWYTHGDSELNWGICFLFSFIIFWMEVSFFGVGTWFISMKMILHDDHEIMNWSL